MRTRHWAALAAAASLGLAACGGGDETLSEDEVVDAIADVCDDTLRDLERLEFPSDDDFSQFGEDASEILDTAVDDLSGIAAPESMSRDLDDLIENFDDQANVARELGRAGTSDEVNEAFDDLDRLNERQAEIADDLGVDACAFGGPEGDDTTTTTEAAAPATTEPPAPATTAAPITLPSTVAPTVPVTPTPTEAPAPGTTFTVVDLTTIFVAPTGFSLAPNSPNQATLDLISSVPDLNAELLEIGVATLVEDGTGTEIADIWVGIARGSSMPATWKDIDCPEGGELRTSANGVPGIVCLGAADSPVWEIFTATVDDFGVSVYTYVPDVSSDLVIDAFLAANP